MGNCECEKELDNSRWALLAENQQRVLKYPSNPKAHYFVALSYHIDLCLYP